MKKLESQLTGKETTGFMTTSFSLALICCLAILTFEAILTANNDILVLGPSGGDVRSLSVHPRNPETFYLGTADGQVYVSQNSGQRWARLEPGLGRRDLVVDNLTFDPRDPNTVYAATWEIRGNKGYLFRSFDGGKHWEMIPLGRYNSTIRAIAIAPSNPSIIAIGISEGVLLSKNAGNTWERISRGYRSLYNVESLAFDDQKLPTLYVGTWHLGWKTPNLGKKWQAIHKGMIDDSDLFSILVEPDNPDVLYASACTGIYKSDSGGTSWVRLKNGLPKEAKRTRTLHMDPSDSETIYAGTTIGLFVTSNAGHSWNQLISDVVVNAVAVQPSQSSVILVASEDAGILRSEDGGSTFNPSNQGFTHRQIGSLTSNPHHPDVYFASVVLDRDYGGFFILNRKTLEWSSFNEGLGRSVGSINVIKPSTLTAKVYLGTDSGLFFGLPNQEAWQLSEATSDLVLLDLAFSDLEEKSLYLAAHTGIFHLDLKTGKMEHREIVVDSGRVHTLLHNVRSSLLFAGTDTGLFRSNDGGMNWHALGNGLPSIPVNVLVKSGTRLFCGTQEGLFFSDENGDRWQRPKGIQPLNIIALSSDTGGVDSRVFASDSLLGNLYTSQNRGKTWKTYERGVSSPRIATLLLVSSHQLFGGTLSEGVHLINSSFD